jgi:CHAT domain-containing protein/tetratricopeptide (TPR) repeat protein
MRKRNGNLSQVRSFASSSWRRIVQAAVAVTFAITASAQTPAQVPDATELEQLAKKLFEARNYKESLGAAQKALALREASSAKDEAAIAATLAFLGEVHYAAAELPQAAQCFERAAAIRERVLGPTALPTAQSLNDLAVVHLRSGDSVRAEPLLERVLDIRRKALGDRDRLVAASMNNLAEIYLTRGDYSRAKPLFEGAVSIQEPLAAKEQPPADESRELAKFLNNLGRLLIAQDDFRAAEAPLLRSLDLREKTFPATHPDVARSLNVLGSLYQQRGELDRAEPYYIRALGIYQKGLGPDDVRVAPAVSNLAVLYLLKGDLERARPLYLRALELRERNLGSRHPEVATSLAAIAVFYQLSGDAEKAIEAQRRSMEIRELIATGIFATGSEQQKLRYADTLQESADITLSMRQQFPTNRSALDLAVTTVLRRKGRVLDAMVDVSTGLRRSLDPEGQRLFDQLAAARATLAKLALQGPAKGQLDAHESAMKTAASEIDRLERLLSDKGAPASGDTRTITVADVQQILAPGAQLVEFVQYRPFDPRATKALELFGPARYAAFVVGKEGDPRWFELGPADEIDKRVAAFRASLRSASRNDIKNVARSLDELVTRPMRDSAREPQHIIVSPDSSLSLIPFGALVDESDRYLVERYEISYVTSGRDLFRLQHSQRAQRPPLVIADPAFDVRGAAPSGAGSGERSNARGFAPLPGTAAEAKALAKIMPGAEVDTGAKASEAVVKAARGPSVLHIASHGFFFDQSPADAAGAQSRGLTPQPQAPTQTSPLLRSGLALAGANTRQGGGSEDGLLTAIEAASLDLSGTKLVVLSACETGVGEVRSGEGVQGLRRAFVIAGAETIAMSLWPVSDVATKDLMVGYYEQLMNGRGRAAGLRDVQLRMLRDSKTTHPFYWASFVVAGQWSGIDAETFM